MLNSTSEAQVRRTREFERQFLPRTMTEWQRRHIRDMCDEQGREVPPDLDKMSEVDAKSLNSALTGKVVEL